MNFYLTSLGCKLNQAEIDRLGREIEAHGHRLVETPAAADWAIVNSCTVTHVAARKSRQLIRQLHRANPRLRVAITGCYATMSPDEAAALEGVALLLSNQEKDQAVERILSLDDPTYPFAPVARPAHGPQVGHTRAFVKIQDGCENHCTYCIVSLARGPQRSRLPEDVLQEVGARLADGYREIVLTGVNIGGYGRDQAEAGPLPISAGWSLARLVRLLLEQTPVERLRLSSIEPWDVTPELLALWDDERYNRRLCRHLHVPLQSGSGATLRRMARRYSPDEFAALVDTIRARIPDVSLTTDVIVGFPGESEAEFAESAAFVERMGFARLHVFRYSRRPGTPADRLPDQVPPKVAQQRSEQLMALGQRLATAFHQRFVGREVEVLFEAHSPEGQTHLWDGLTDNYVRVVAPSERELGNVLARVRCHSADENGLRGELLNP
ncbi:MAG: tRNA (N(6)-L-threonylcarbamoyladenosine(37)-C(2))-methylthiotransferase MtaB [Chloroflexi bacterium]|jgi:threonylcarbamoyladenosine tRNA methylthiotransferase MtaB|nr:tRNA (N(6)-L-threonylcarbamoyladenosine(37)-C(2))-methylthiotransferase MtaB [Chloroflexota bacterium]